MATVEAAIALATLIVVVVCSVGAILAVGQQVQCIDAPGKPRGSPPAATPHVRRTSRDG